MPAKSVRRGSSHRTDPVIHDLPSVRYGAEDVIVRLEVRRTDDGTWRGRLLFGSDPEAARFTTDIFCAGNETDLWQSVRGLRDHHFRDLYRSISE